MLEKSEAWSEVENYQSTNFLKELASWSFFQPEEARCWYSFFQNGQNVSQYVKVLGAWVSNSTLTLMLVQIWKSEKLAILQASGGTNMIELLEMMVKVLLEAVVSDVGNGVIAMNEYIYSLEIDYIMTGIVDMKKKEMSR